MKKQRLNLENLKVKSFVTDLKYKSSKTVKGGFALVSADCSIDHISRENPGASKCACL
ncbi:MAG: pinensin family lanthipeptide [Bacteroidota bacterium]